MYKGILAIMAITATASPAQAAPIYLDCDLQATAALTLHTNLVLDERSRTASFAVKETSGIWTDKPTLFLPDEIKIDLGTDGVRRRALSINRETLGLTYTAVPDGKSPQELHGQCRIAEQHKRQI